MRSLLLCLAAVLLAWMLVGCGERLADLAVWIEQQKIRKPPPLQPLPEALTFERLDYAAQAMRDPFSAGALRDPGTRPHPDPMRPKQPLESFSLDRLKMVGTIGVNSRQEVLIQDPAGLIHRVRIGAFMGLNYGRIVAVSPTRVELSELTSDGSGGWIPRTSIVALP